MNIDSQQARNGAILVTGGAGFIGTNFTLSCLALHWSRVVVLDKFTYAGCGFNLTGHLNDDRLSVVEGDISDTGKVLSLLQAHKISAIVNFAAETHVDRSIASPDAFLTTNVMGTYRLLEAATTYWRSLDQSARAGFRFVHVSTDEVYGSLDDSAPAFSEQSQYRPNSPYAASKAASDHFVRAWQKTYGLPTITTHCSNNYGPYQFPEKLIPLVICNALSRNTIPVYGDGRQVRDWIHVDDHCNALHAVLAQGKVGETYGIGGENQLANIEVVKSICSILDEVVPASNSFHDLIAQVADRPGHDRRYAIDTSKIFDETGWQPLQDFHTGIRKTVLWYLENDSWLARVKNSEYHRWIEMNYASR